MKTAPQKELQKGAIIELSVENLAYGGRGIARHNGMVVFVEHTLPGDVISARVTKRKPQYAEAEAVRIVKPSPHRLEPPCPIFQQCGGCTWQNFAYPEQLRYKQQHVAESLQHIGRQHSFVMHRAIASPAEWRYRNKMEYSIDSDETGRIRIGFHKPGDFRSIVDVRACLIQPTVFDEVLAYLGEALNEAAACEGRHFISYDKMTHTGFLRQLVLRHSAARDEFLVALLTGAGEWKGVREFCDAFLRRFPQCRGFLWGINAGMSDVVRLDEVRHQAGEGYIEETLGTKRFRVSTFSFFQTNSAGAKLLYDTVMKFAELTGRESVLDAYCGTGTIGIYLSGQAKRVTGIELVRDAVWDARANAQLNGATNCTFLAGEMRDILASLPQTLGTDFDRVIVDPPRGGMDKRSLRHLIGIRAPLLVYVSCNPTTLARDVVTLGEAGYVPEEVQPVDMFPHTYHIESVIKFRLATAADRLV